MTDAFPKAELTATIRCQRGALLPCKLDWPLRKVRYRGGHPLDGRPPGATLWQDAWGVTWRKESPDAAMMPFPIAHPVDGRLAGLDQHPWPDPDDPRRFTDLTAGGPGDNHLLVGEHPFALYERAWLLAGLQPLLAAMMEAPGQVDELFARIGTFEEAIARHYVTTGVEAAWIADDYGMNRALVFSPGMWRRFVRPHLRRIVQCYHDAGALVFLHTCGNITALIDDFLEAGIDALDPLQPICNRLDHIRQQTAGRMCLCGGVQASTLHAGDTKGTIVETCRLVAELGADGGYIVGPDDEGEYPASTHRAMLSAVEHYRQSSCHGT